MVDLLAVYDEETIEAFDDQALRESLMLAELADAGVIPPSQLPRLHLFLEGERPQLVSQAMDSLDGTG